MNCVKKSTEQLIRLCFPNRCPICDRPAKPFNERICDKCRREIKYLHQPLCLKCGKEISRADEAFCEDCKRMRHVFDQGIALYDYRSMSASLYRFKYEKRQEYAAFYGQELAFYLGERILGWHPDALIPVPIHKKRKQIRGYNQSELLAKELGARLGIPVLEQAIVREKNTIPQKELTPEGRRSNVKSAFKISLSDVKLEAIVIIDDIYTTGSTVDAIAARFREQGVRRIFVVTLAVGRGL